MQKDNFITVALHFSIFAAKGDSNWPYIFKSLGKLLAQNGCENKTSQKNVLIFTFFHPHTAFASVLRSLQTVKKEYVSRDYIKALPFKIIFHLDSQDSVELPLEDESHDLWEFLEFGHLYVSKFLKVYLEQNNLLPKLPEHDFKSTENLKLLDLVFKNPSELKIKKLFPNRALPRKDAGKICFYCGMTNHKPGECPSRFLTMDTQGLQDIGYLTFEELNTAYGASFENFPKYANSLTSEITTEDIRKSPPLMAFISFFDVSSVFQLRFFYAFFATFGLSWPKLGEKKQNEISNTTLKTGFDYLLQGRHLDAHEQFGTEANKASGKLTYAHIGLAFIALEQGADMTNHLVTAVTLALTAEEKIYCYLLLSRYYETTGENQKAERMIAYINKLDYHSSDAAYRAFQIAAPKGISLEEALKFKNLILEKKFFMAALIDPFLAPVSDLVESILLYVFQTNIRAAKSHYVNACNSHKELMLLVEEKEEIHEKIEKTLHDLGNIDTAGKYYKILGAVKKAKDTFVLCNNLTSGIVNNIQKKQSRIAKRIQKLKSFWSAYPFKSYFKKFNRNLTHQKRELDKIGPFQGKENNNVLFKRNKEILQGIEHAVAELEKEKQKMESLRNTIEYLTVFPGMLVISEGIMISVGITLILITSFLLGNKPWNNPIAAFQAMPHGKEIMLALIALAAPLLALLLTMKNSLFRKMKKKS